MKNKRGISPLLAAVLLLALTISMAAVVSNYVIKKTKEFNPEKLTEESIYCESVSLGYMITDPEKLGIYEQGKAGFDHDPITGNPIIVPGVSLFAPITLINRGAFSIHQFIINAPGLESRPSLIYDENLKPSVLKPGKDNKYNINIQINTNNQNPELKIIPVIKDPEKNQSVKCITRQLVLNYKQICLDIKNTANC